MKRISAIVVLFKTNNRMRSNKVTLAMLGILACTVSGVADTPAVFDVDGIRYMETKAGDDGHQNVMVCSPNHAGREYQFPFSDEGVAVIPESVTHDGNVYSVTAIEDMTFFGEPKLKSISLPQTIASVGGGNFSGCCNLENLDLSKATLSGTLAVEECPALKTLRLPQSQEGWLFGSFNGEYRLESLWLPSIMGENSGFLTCFLTVASIDRIYSLSPEPPAFDSGLDGQSSDELPDDYWYLFGNSNLWQNQPVIYVPEGAVEAYRASRSWHCFDDIREYDTAGIANMRQDNPAAPSFHIEGGRITADNGAAFDLYDLSGRKVANHDLNPGIYIARSAGACAKLCVRH